MIVDCVADLHGFYPELEGGDLLIVAGDLTKRDTVREHEMFRQWLRHQKYNKYVVIAGNHDNIAMQGFYEHPGNLELYNLTYLCDSGTEFDGLKIWGSPWTKRFEGMNPHCMAFTVDTDKELAEKWKLIPNGIEILVTHSPSQGVLDDIEDYTRGQTLNVGSESLIKPMIKSGCKLHVFGHVHEGYGKFYNAINGITSVNASHVNEYYEPVNKPIRVIL